MEGLNEAHQRRILLTFLDLRRRLEQMEDAILRPARLSPFFEHEDDLPEEQAKAILQCFTRLRMALVAAAEKLEIPVEVRRNTLTRELSSLLAYLQNSLAELHPSQLRGYGAVGQPGGETLRQVQQELLQLLDELAGQIFA